MEKGTSLGQGPPEACEPWWAVWTSCSRAARRLDGSAHPRPHLVSLDLGFNDLTDLQGMVGSLSSLRHLRLLVLQGNPLALVPYYRGLTVDSLARLCVLDDITVSPSEKHQFRGISHSGGEVADARAPAFPSRCPSATLLGGLSPQLPGGHGPWLGAAHFLVRDLLSPRDWDLGAEGIRRPGPPRSPPSPGTRETFCPRFCGGLTSPPCGPRH